MSTQTHIQIWNDSEVEMQLSASNEDNQDWDGVSRPTRNINGVSLAVGQYTNQREELNNNSNSAWFTLGFSGLTFRIDQMDARHGKNSFNLSYNSSKSNGVYQIAGKDENTVIITAWNPSKWMKWIPDNTPLQRVSIPGTHDTCTYNYSTPVSSTFVVCQHLNITEQLNHGIRFFDLRINRNSNNGGSFTLFHGNYYLNMNFDDVLNQVIPFLQGNPSETVLFSMKDDGGETDSKPTCGTILKSYINKNPDFWFNNPGLPTMEHARGKIILISRFKFDVPDIGINLSSMKYNDFTETSDYFVQDCCDADVSSKLKFIKQALDSSANENNKDKLIISFTTTAVPTTSDSINPQVLNDMTSLFRRTGILAMNFPSDEIIAKIIHSNIQFVGRQLGWVSIVSKQYSTHIDANSTGKQIYMSNKHSACTAWGLVRYGNGHFRIVSRDRAYSDANKYLDANDNGNSVYLSSYLNDDHTLWAIEVDSNHQVDGWFRLVNVDRTQHGKSDKYLDAGGDYVYCSNFGSSDTTLWSFSSSV